MVDRSELYPGAVVTVRATVMEVAAGVRLEFGEPGANGWAPLSAILSVEPRPLAVGDRVRRAPDGARGRILAIDTDADCAAPEAWVRFNGWRDTVILSDLTRLPEEPAPAEPAMRFKVGDRVMTPISFESALIVAVDRDLAWVRWAKGDGGIFNLSDLSPAPAEESAP